MTAAAAAATNRPTDGKYSSAHMIGGSRLSVGHASVRGENFRTNLRALLVSDFFGGDARKTLRTRSPKKKTRREHPTCDGRRYRVGAVTVGAVDCDRRRHRRTDRYVESFATGCDGNPWVDFRARGPDCARHVWRRLCAARRARRDPTSYDASVFGATRVVVVDGDDERTDI